MKFKNTHKGFVGILVLLLVVIATGGGVYVYQKNKIKTDIDGNYSYPAASTSKEETEANTSAKLTPPDMGVKIVPNEVKVQVTTQNNTYRNEQLKFETQVDTRLIISGIKTDQQNRKYVSFDFPNKEGFDIKAGFALLIPDNDTSCSGEVSSSTYKNKNGMYVVKSFSGDAGWGREYYSISINEKMYCVISLFGAGEVGAGIQSTQFQDIVTKIYGDLSKTVNLFVDNFKPLR
ncbi:MAG: hypothetical protein V4686_01075 [Patescibacteria group bacterium]